MLRRFAATNPAAATTARSAAPQRRGIVFFTSSSAGAGSNVIVARERMALNFLAEGLAIYLTFKLLKERRRGKVRDIFDLLKASGINADELANSNMLSYENYKFDIRFFGNYIGVCAALCLVTFVFPASFHGPSLTRMMMGLVRKGKR